jgi:hypothetical protein
VKKLGDDFEDFLNSNVQPPAELSEKIFAMVRRDLNPSAPLVFTKLLGIHAVISFFTLSLCPQFGIRLFGSGSGLMQYFMGLGDSGCMAACGVIFLGSTSFFSALILSQPESKRLLSEWPIHALLLMGFSLAFFASVDAYLTLAAVLWWIGGGLVGAYLLLWGGISLRKLYFVRSSI